MKKIEIISMLSSLHPNGKGVEIGVFNGHFSKEILGIWNGTLYMVDTWRKLTENYTHNDIYAESYSEAIKNIAGYEERGIMIRATSEHASSLFNDNSLDFIYIDANHAYDFVKQDISLWYPKLKSGGIFSGHDYFHGDWWNTPLFQANGKDKCYYSCVDGSYQGLFGVNSAVDEFAKEEGYDINLTEETNGSWWLIKK